MSFYQYLIKKQLNFKLALLLLGILMTGAVFLAGQKYLFLKGEINNLTKTETAVTEEINQEKVVYIIDFGAGKTKSYRIIPDQGATVFSLLESLAGKENFTVSSTFYKDVGVLVQSIDGIKNGADNKYWQYWVNGDLPMVAADKKEVKTGDKVEWRFAPSDF